MKSRGFPGGKRFPPGDSGGSPVGGYVRLAFKPIFIPLKMVLGTFAWLDENDFD
jgi:hypothetical protein